MSASNLANIKGRDFNKSNLDGAKGKLDGDKSNMLLSNNDN